MTTSSPTPPTTPAPAAATLAAQPAAPRAPRDPIGRVIAVSCAQVTVGLSVKVSAATARATVGKYLGIVSGGAVTVGLITEIG